ncbi:IucA/IucC family protein [Psychrobacter sp. I-STPA6b]|uniref:IucA/IucC family protein n=1 Tax=Psychrobacter sp. I-STPA6b TaxID=2585718 RepID=UPI001D0C6FC6|nr:IucA/IucC family protein [Psychrobacter sp. I-STPA6b]
MSTQSKHSIASEAHLASPDTQDSPEMIQSTMQMLTWQLTANLIECCLLENWIASQRISITSVQQYLQAHANLTLVLVQLPVHYQMAGLNSQLLKIEIDAHRTLLLLVEPAYCAPWRLLKPLFPILLTQSDDANTKASATPYQLDIIECEQQTLQLLLEATDQTLLSQSGVSKLKEDLQLARLHSQWSAQATLPTCVYTQPHWYQTLQTAEQWASWVDRPFHPIAKAKTGLDHDDYLHYMAEYKKPVTLAWLAVAKTHLMTSDMVYSPTSANMIAKISDIGDTASDTQTQQISCPASRLLTAKEQQALHLEMQQKNLLDSHIAIPVHPWQLSHAIPQAYDKDLADGTVVILDFAQMTCFATSSMRSMLLPFASPYSVKLPIGIHALNSKRYLPALKLINGEKNQAILMQALQKDEVLNQHLHLWDERFWWGYMSPEHLNDKSSINPFFYQEKPTQLGAMLRILPEPLCDDNIRLIPMGSLGMLNHQQGQSHHIFDEIMAQRQQDTNPENALQCFRQMCDVFFDLHLRCLRIGFLPELHGQNILLVLTNHSFTGLLLRDHDSVRIHLPWLEAHGIADPEYLSPPNFKNRLYRDTPEELIFYLQTLGVLVSIRAIIESMTLHYGIDESELWQQVKLSISHYIEQIDFSKAQKQLLQQLLIDAPHYPHKTLLLPVIERGHDAHGSMPAGESLTRNPLKPLGSVKESSKPTSNSQLLTAYQSIDTSTIGHLNSQGYLSDIKAIFPCQKTVAGVVRTVQLRSDNTDIIRQALLNAQAGDVLCIDAQVLAERACWGALRTCSALQEQLSAIIVLGKVTDSMQIQQLGLPVFAQGVSALTTFKSENTQGHLDVDLEYPLATNTTKTTIHSGDIAVMDNDGVFILTPELAESLLADCQKKQSDDDAKLKLFLQLYH